METKNTEIHIGILIKNYLNSKRIPKAAVGRKINKDGNTILRYQKKPTLKTDVILELSHAIKHNFFADIAALLPPDYSKDNVSEIDVLKAQIALQQHEIEILKAEKAVLKEFLGKM